MKSRVFGIVMCLVLMMGVLPSTAMAVEIVDSGKCGENATWTLTDDGTLTISGEGEMEDYFPNEAPWCVHAEVITEIIIKYGVTSVGDWCFSGCSNVESISFSDTVEMIGRQPLLGCNKITELYIPASVIWIDYHNYDIFDSDSLKAVWVDENNKNYSSDEYGSFIDKTTQSLVWVSRLYEGKYTVSDGISCIGFDAFDDCKYITEIIIPESVEQIDCLFQSCYELMTFNVDEGNKYFSNDDNGVLFNKDMTKLILVPRAIEGEYAIPEGVITVAQWAINGFEKITSIYVPSSVEIIEESAIINSRTLNKIIVDENNDNYSNDAFGVLFDSEMKTLIQAPQMLGGVYSIPDGVITISDYAFFNCDKLVEVTIPNSVADIGEYTFSDCKELKLIFNGEAPLFGDDCFGTGYGRSNATIYYPRSSKKWERTINDQERFGCYVFEEYIAEESLNDAATNGKYILILCGFVLAGVMIALTYVIIKKRKHSNQ